MPTIKIPCALITRHKDHPSTLESLRSSVSPIIPKTDAPLLVKAVPSLPDLIDEYWPLATTRGIMGQDTIFRDVTINEVDFITFWDEHRLSNP